VSCKSNPNIKIFASNNPRKSVGDVWWKYVGLQGKVIAIDRFGIPAPGNTVMKELGMTKDTVIAAAK
jgi:transketolase